MINVTKKILKTVKFLMNKIKAHKIVQSVKINSIQMITYVKKV